MIYLTVDKHEWKCTAVTVVSEQGTEAKYLAPFSVSRSKTSRALKPSKSTKAVVLQGEVGKKELQKAFKFFE